VYRALLVALAVIGCRGSDAKKTRTSRDPGYCDHTATGTQAGRGHSKGGSDAVGSDYWTPDTGPGLLVIRCTGFLTFDFVSAPDLAKADLPMAPGKYEIRAIGASKIVMLAHDDDGHPFSAERGTLELTRFDADGVAGAFSFELADMSGKTDTVNIHVTGSFDLPRPDHHVFGP
jgi:hypothetical protein